MSYVDNRTIAEVFSQMADLMEIQGANGFRIRAFRRVAQALENLSEGAATMLADGTLQQVPGIGDGAIKRIQEILQTGSCEDLRQLRSELPAGLFDLLQVSGLGPKKVKLFYDELGIASIDDLEAAARAGHLAALPRMGKKSQDKLLGEIEAFRRRTGRVNLGVALPQGEALLAALRELPEVLRSDLAGSSRRRRETIGDLDLLVASEHAEPVMDRFVSLPAVAEVMLRGDTKCSVRLHGGLQVDLRVLLPESYGAALHYFTGSQMHNIAIRDRAKRAGLRINEYGVYTEPAGERQGGASEEEVFASVGLPYIPPELRENRGEIEAAERGELPQLVELADLRGDLHAHLASGDAHGETEAESLTALAVAAKQAGMSYLALCQPSASYRAEQAAARQPIMRQLEDDHGVRLFQAIEVEIEADGSLALPSDVLAQADWVIGAVHAQRAMSAEEMTARILRALDSGALHCLAHPTGRLLGQQEGYPVDLDAVLQAAQRSQVAVEINSSPLRLDLDANHCRQASKLGVDIMIGSDARQAAELSQLAFGVYTARRGWLEAKNVLNTRPLDELESWLRR